MQFIFYWLSRSINGVFSMQKIVFPGSHKVLIRGNCRHCHKGGRWGNDVNISGECRPIYVIIIIYVHESVDWWTDSYTGV